LKNIQTWWLLLTLSFGLTYVFVVPPFQSPDEPNHFLKIYHISEGNFLGEVSQDKQQLGGYLPKSLSNTYETYYLYAYDKEKLFSIDSIKTDLSKQLTSTELDFISFPNTARYAFTAYLPQVVAFCVLKKINCPPLTLMYAGRLTAFFFWIILVYYAISITPVFKEIFMLLTFLPTSLSTNTTLSADVVTNALLFVCLALFLKFKFKKEIPPNRELILFGLILLLTSWQKIVYFPLLFLVLLIPKSKFEGINKKVLFFLILLVSNLIVVFYWSHEVNKLIYPTGNKFFTTYVNMRTDAQINPTLQVEHILRDPLTFIKIFTEVSFSAYQSNFSTYLTSFGWEGLQVPSGLLYVFKFFFLAYLLIQKNIFKIWERIYLSLLGHGLVMLFLLSQHLHWDGVGDFFHYTYLGKYYIPIYPLFFFALTGIFSNSVFKEDYEKYINVLFLVLTITIQIDFLILILERFYI
jgi:uncharacterized membrane protein